MGDEFPSRQKVETNSLRVGIAYGIGTLGAIPIRYQQPRFPSIRRRNQNDTQEQALMTLNNGVMPNIFALSSFTGLSKPSSAQLGNQAVLRKGVNLGMNSGHRLSLHGAFVEIACNANIYSNSVDSLLQWITSVTETPIIKGMAEFADGSSIPITVEIATSFDWTDPLGTDDSSTPLERLFNIAVNYKVLALSARIESIPLEKAFILSTKIDQTAGVTEVVIPVTDLDDWP